MTASRSASLVLACVVAAAAVAATSHLPKSSTKAAIKAYVEQAAEVVRKSGPSCATFASPEWRGGPYYVFVVGPDDKVICHATASLIGKATESIVNSKGEKVGTMIDAVARGTGKGWVKYMWVPPGKTKEELKSTYVMGVTGPDGRHYAVGSGGYDVK
jgi:hypothetical protein